MIAIAFLLLMGIVKAVEAMTGGKLLPLQSMERTI
jgi:hypothetical protein